MSLELIEAQIGKFLKNGTPEILAIKGAWGVGKTFLWNKNLNAAKERYGIALKQYAYVSLFGINSVDELKLTIFMQVMSVKHIGSEQDSNSMTNMDRIISSWSRKGISFLKELPYVRNFWSTTQSLAFLSLKETLICIDDFERKGKELDARDVLGLVSLLKEQKKCKIALVFNEEGLENESDEFKKFREKVIDIELIFKPTSPECTRIALPDDPTSMKLRAYIELLNINNIRIINKIARLAQAISSHLEGFEAEVLDRALRSLTLFAWSLFSGTEEAPSYDFIVKTDHYKLMWGDPREEEGVEKDEKEQAWDSMLMRYGFHGCDDFDLQIANAVKHGYVDEKAFLSEAKKVNERALSSKAAGALAAAWAILDESFDDNEDEFLDKLNNSFRNDMKYLGPSDLDSVVTTLRRFEKIDLADNLTKEYIDAHGPNLLTLHKRSLRGHFRDEKLIEMIAAAYESQETVRTAKEVLEKIADKNGWDPDDETILSKTSPEEYYRLFKNERGPHLASYISTCLDFGKIVGSSPDQQTIASNATAALEKIAGESRLNALRVRRHGIRLQTSKEKNYS
jgi:hypothetical protein